MPPGGRCSKIKVGKLSFKMDGLHNMALVAVALLQLAETSQAVSRPPPPFSWDTLPVFIQVGNNSGPFNDAAIDVLAKFAMVTLTKWQGPCGQQANATPACNEEMAMLAEARRIKQVNPNVSTLLYWNRLVANHDHGAKNDIPL